MRDLTRARDTAVDGATQDAPADLGVPAAAGAVLSGYQKTWSKAHLDLVDDGAAGVSRSNAWCSRSCCWRSARGGSASSGWSRRSATRCRTGRWPPWSPGLMAMRGLDLTSASTVPGRDRRPSRFQTPRELMAYLGLVPSGGFPRRHDQSAGPITKTGNWRARRTLVECSSNYQHPPRVGRASSKRWKPPRRRFARIAWKAQCRLLGGGPAHWSGEASARPLR